MKLFRRLIVGLIVLAIAGALAWAYRPRAVAVSVATVTRGPLQVVVEEDGRTRIRERYEVTPPVTGYLRRLDLHAGDAVTAGQVLFTLEPLPPGALDARAQAEARARVARAAAVLRATQAEADAAVSAADFATRERARLRPLFDTGQVPKAQYDRAAAEAERTAAAVVSARAAIDVARYEQQAAATSLRYAAGERTASGRMQVTAPVAGRVLEIRHEDEGVVNAGQSILSIGDPRSLEIVTEVLSSDAVRIRPGNAVRVDRWGGTTVLDGRVRTVDPAAFTKISALGVEEQRVKVVTDLSTPPEVWSALGDAYRVETRFVVSETPDALRVPHSSLFRSGDDWGAFVVEEGRLAVRKVRIGRRGLLDAEVLDGLAEGDRIVTYPDDTLAAGVRVEVRETEP